MKKRLPTKDVKKLTLEQLVKHHYQMIVNLHISKELERDDALFISAQELLDRFHAPVKD